MCNEIKEYSHLPLYFPQHDFAWKVNREMAIFLDLIAQGKPLCICSFIVDRLLHCRSSKDIPIPFARVITCILVFYGVELNEHEEFNDGLPPLDGAIIKWHNLVNEEED